MRRANRCAEAVLPHGVIPAKAGIHPCACQRPLRLWRCLRMDPGLRRGDTVGVARSAVAKVSACDEAEIPAFAGMTWWVEATPGWPREAHLRTPHPRRHTGAGRYPSLCPSATATVVATHQDGPRPSPG